MSISVQIHPDSYEAVLFPARGDSEPAFAVVKAFEDRGSVTLFLPSIAACDELIRAAVEAKRLLSPPEPPAAVSDEDATAILAKAIETGEPVIVEDVEDVEDDDEPRPANGPESWCAATAGDGDFAVICNSQDGHDGPVHVAWAADGGVVACWHVTAPAVAS